MEQRRLGSRVQGPEYVKGSCERHHLPWTDWPGSGRTSDAGTLSTGLGIAAAVLLLIVGTVAARGQDEQESDLNDYLSEVRPHLALAGWTDMNLLNAGNDICDALDASQGDVRALIPDLISASKSAGYSDAEAQQVTNDWVFIVDAAIHLLCPEWTASYNEQYPRMPS